MQSYGNHFWELYTVEFGVIIFITLMLYMLPISLLGRWLAIEKGYSSVSWFCICFFFGIIGLIAIAGAPDKTANSAEKTNGHKSNNFNNPYRVIENTDIKEQPDPNARSIIELENNDIVDFLSEAYEGAVDISSSGKSAKSIWYKVRYKQYEGWCLLKHIEKNNG